MLPNEMMAMPFGVAKPTRRRIPTMVSAVPIEVRGRIDTRASDSVIQEDAYAACTGATTITTRATVRTLFSSLLSRHRCYPRLFRSAQEFRSNHHGQHSLMDCTRGICPFAGIGRLENGIMLRPAWTSTEKPATHRPNLVDSPWAIVGLPSSHLSSRSLRPKASKGHEGNSPCAQRFDGWGREWAFPHNRNRNAS